MSTTDVDLSTLQEDLSKLAKRAEDMIPDNPDEPGTVLSLVQPFFVSLGYDVSDPKVCKDTIPGGLGNRR